MELHEKFYSKLKIILGEISTDVLLDFVYMARQHMSGGPQDYLAVLLHPYIYLLCS